MVHGDTVKNKYFLYLGKDPKTRRLVFRFEEPTLSWGKLTCIVDKEKFISNNFLIPGKEFTIEKETKEDCQFTYWKIKVIRMLNYDPETRKIKLEFTLEKRLSSIFRREL
jgi:hypothetical protein